MTENSTNIYEEISGEELLSGANEESSVEEASEEVVEEVSRGDIGFTPEALPGALGIMGKGMLGIFIVTAIIVAVTVVLNKTTSSGKKEKKDK